MAKWIPCGTDFIVGDVLRWREPAWRPKELGRRSKIIGEHQVVAQVQAEGDNGFVRLVVKQCVTKRDEYWRYEVPPLAIGTEINRRREPMAKRGLERYQWGGTDGESVRGLLTKQICQGGRGRQAVRRCRIPKPSGRGSREFANISEQANVDHSFSSAARKLVRQGSRFYPARVHTPFHPASCQGIRLYNRKP